MMVLQDWPVRVHADFNDIGLDGEIYVRQVDAQRDLKPDDPVILFDGDGNTQYGWVLELREPGQVVNPAVRATVRMAIIGVTSGTFWSVPPSGGGGI